MNLTYQSLPSLTLMGLSLRTDNATEQDPQTGKIGPLIARYFEEKVGERLENPIKPGMNYALYTDYETDFRGAYTYLFGEAAKEGTPAPHGLTLCQVPAQTYAVFTVGPGPMPQLVIDAWHAIWKMGEKDFGGKRTYLGDFEYYDTRSHDPQHATVDICIGIER